MNNITGYFCIIQEVVTKRKNNGQEDNISL